MLTLLLLPGMDGTGQFFDDFLQALGPGLATIIVSYPPDEPLDYAALTQIARSNLPSDQPFVLLAESFSGPIAVSIAASAPPGLRGLVLCGSFVKNPRPVLRLLSPMINFLPLHLVPSWLLGRAVLGRFSSRSRRHALSAALARVAPAVLRARLRAVLDVDVAFSLPGLRVPVLYLRASQDRVVPAACSRLIARLMPAVTIVEIDAPHFLLQATPGEAAYHLARFIEEVAAP